MAYLILCKTTGTGPEVITYTWDISGATYNSVNLSISGQDIVASGLTMGDGGTKMYMGGNNSNTIYQYTLSTPWDLSTASYASKSKDISGVETGPTGVYFKSDGSKMYVTGSGGNIHEFAISVPWDVSTSTFTSTTSISTQVSTTLTGIFIRPDGTKLYVTEDNNTLLSGTVYQYSLVTPWDLSTLSYDSVSYSTDTQENSPRGVAFRPDGAKMFVTGVENDGIYQYTLSTPWDISSASYDSVFVGSPGSNVGPRDSAFDPDGTKMFIVESADRIIYEMDL